MFCFHISTEAYWYSCKNSQIPIEIDSVNADSELEFKTCADPRKKRPAIDNQMKGHKECFPN